MLKKVGIEVVKAALKELLKEELEPIKESIKELRTEVKADIKSLNLRIDGMQQDINTVKIQITEINKGIADVNEEIRYIRSCHRNGVIDITEPKLENK